MNILIRKWKPEDIPAMVRLTFEWGFETTEEKMTRHLKRVDEVDYADVFVAECDGKAVGRVFVAEHLTLGSDPFAEIHALVVDQDYRRKGIGKALIDAANKWAADRGFGLMRLRTNAKRPEANVFYPAIGFRLEKVQNVYVIDLEKGRYEFESL
jgi:GNAT superfamily N-acetyltransferase